MTGLSRAASEGAVEIPKFFGQRMMAKEQQARQQQEDETIRQLTGQDVAGLTPELKKIFLEKTLGRKEEHKPDLSGAINAINSLEQLVGQEGIGLSGAFNPFSKARFNRGQFKPLQAAIMPLFKSMFPRGMSEKEFKFVNDNYVPQADDTEETIKGKIEGLKQLVQQQSGQMQMPQKQKRRSLEEIYG